MANLYEIDTLVRLVSSYTQVQGGTPVDPTDVKVYVLPPGGSTTIYTFLNSQVVKDSVGNYHYDLLLNKTGVWTYKWQGTGTAQVTSPDQMIDVDQTVFSPPL